MKDLEWRLENLREEAGYTQKKISIMLGYSANVYGSYERGERRPTIETLIKLADIFNVSLDYLIRGREFNGKTKDKHNSERKAFEKLIQIFNRNGVEQPYILELEKWSQLSAEDLHDLSEHFEYIVYRAEKRN